MLIGVAPYKLKDKDCIFIEIKWVIKSFLLRESSSISWAGAWVVVNLPGICLFYFIIIDKNLIETASQFLFNESHSYFVISNKF